MIDNKMNLRIIMTVSFNTSLMYLRISVPLDMEALSSQEEYKLTILIPYQQISTVRLSLISVLLKISWN
jgi:hypothetical protein